MSIQPCVVYEEILVYRLHTYQRPHLIILCLRYFLKIHASRHVSLVLFLCVCTLSVVCLHFREDAMKMARTVEKNVNPNADGSYSPELEPYGEDDVPPPVRGPYSPELWPFDEFRHAEILSPEDDEAKRAVLKKELIQKERQKRLAWGGGAWDLGEEVEGEEGSEKNGKDSSLTPGGGGAASQQQQSQGNDEPVILDPAAKMIS